MEELKAYYNFISKLSEKTWAELLPNFKQEKLLKNEVFSKENEVSKRFGFLQSGVVRAFFINQEGKEYNKQFFAGPASIGPYSSLVSGSINRIAQQALTDCIVYTCDYKVITNLYDKHPDMERLSRKIAEYYFIEKEKKELEIVLLDATQRYIIFQKEFPTLEQQIAQFHIASYLGVTATQLSRLRAGLHQK